MPNRQDRRNFICSSVTCASAAAFSSAAALAAESGTHAPAWGVPGYDYRLPKIAHGSTLLFQGDSITDMRWGRNQSDRNHYLGHSYVYLIAARLHTEMPEAGLNFLTRGNSGNTVADLRVRWQADALDLNPDVLSILIGVNDVGRAVRAGSQVNAQAFESDYRWLLDQSRECNPALKLVLLEPFVLPVTRVKDAWQAWRGQIDRLREIVARLASDYQAVLLETQDIFDEAARRVSPSHWIWDGVHPLPQGHELIARNWIEAVAKAWQ